MANENVRDWLQRGGPWPEMPRTIETHAALVFLAGDRAYKMKKPVNLGYLDFASLEARRDALSRELALNARTAPETYLRLVPIVEKAGTFVLDGDGAAVEWLLEMRRFPDGALLAEAADRGALTEAMVEDLAAHAARFHDTAERVPGRDWPAAVARIARENTADLLAQQTTFAGRDLDRAIAARESRLAACATALARQSLDVRRCHGDMHLANAFLDRGKPTLFDCIEFDDFYATIPPLYDVAFLLMDLIARGMPRHANRALNAWIVHRAPEQWPDIMASLTALPLYLALRAEIRAKTEGRRPSGQANALRYIDLAETLLDRRPPKLIVIGGLSGTGKSSLAKNIAWHIGGSVGAVHLRTDEIRKRLAGVALTQALPSSAYDQAATDRVYAKLFELAQGALAAGASVVLDAVFAREPERAAVSAMARTAGAGFTGLWLEAAPDVLEKRLAHRTGDVSDADAAVLRRQLSYDLGAIDWCRLDAGLSEADVAQNALAAIEAP